MDRYLVIAVAIAMATVHIVRPDITNPIISFIAPRVGRFPSRGITVTLSVLTNGIAAANRVRQGLLGTIMRGVHSLQSLPWEKYYTSTANIFYLGTKSLAVLDAASSEAGYPWIGVVVYLAVCVVAAGSVVALILAIRLLLSTLYAVAVWPLSIVRNVGSFFRFIYRLVFRPPVMPNPVAVHQGAVPAPANMVPVMPNPVAVHQGAVPAPANMVPLTSNPGVVHQGASSTGTRKRVRGNSDESDG